MHITYSGVLVESLLGKKPRCRVIEVVRLRVDGGRPFDGCQDMSLLAEVQFAKPVGDEVQASEEEGLGWLEDGRNPHPNRWECRKLQ